MKRRDFAIGLGASGLGAAAIGGVLGLGGSAAGRAGAYSAPVKAVTLSAPGTGWPGGAVRLEPSVAHAPWQKALSGAIPGLGRSDALVVIQDGRLAYEGYGADHDATTRHVSWSMAKSFTQALVGIAVLEGKADIDRPLATVAHPDPKLTLRTLLNLTDGLKWDEAAYEITKSDATRMLYGDGRLDGAAFAGARPLAYPPGTHWRYSTGSFQLAAAELQALLFPAAKTPQARREVMADYIRNRLFQPLGMSTGLAEFDAAGTFYGGSLIYASALDYARFGELYRNDGVVGGRRLLPEGWVKFARTPTVKPDYGAGFWLEAPTGLDGKQLGLMGGKGPMDAFSAEGHDGQVIVVVPSKKAVIVRLGLTDDGVNGWKVLGEWVNGILAGLPG